MINTTYLKLIAPFPVEAYKADKSRGSKNIMTSVGPQWLVDRLNTVLGLDGWHFTESFKEVDKGVICFGKLYLHKNKVDYRAVESVGYKDWCVRKNVWKDKKQVIDKDGNPVVELIPTNIGDVYKSAATDSLSKAASKIGLANSVFKGLIPMDDLGYGKVSPNMTALENDYRDYMFRLSQVPELVSTKLLEWSKTAKYEQLKVAVCKLLLDLDKGFNEGEGFLHSSPSSSKPEVEIKPKVSDMKFILDNNQ